MFSWIIKADDLLIDEVFQPIESFTYEHLKIGYLALGFICGMLASICGVVISANIADQTMRQSMLSWTMAMAGTYFLLALLRYVYDRLTRHEGLLHHRDIFSRLVRMSLVIFAVYPFIANLLAPLSDWIKTVDAVLGILLAVFEIAALYFLTGCERTPPKRKRKEAPASDNLVKMRS